jgi:hypothetical protein
MADQLQIPDDQLRPGDLVEVEYLVTGGNDTLLGMAVHDVKKTLATDTRFHYQGSRWDDRVDLSDGQTYRYLIITVMVADPSKVTGNHPKVEIQQAGIGVVAIGALIGLVATAIVAYSGQLAYTTYSVKRIAADPSIPDDVKVAALTAIGAGAKKPLVGGSVTAAGGAVVTAVIIIGVLWALSLSRRGASAE